MDWMKAGIVAGDFKLEDGWLFTTKTGLYEPTVRVRWSCYRPRRQPA